MTKALSKAARKRQAKERRAIALAGGETAPNPARGTDRRGTGRRETPEEARSVALAYRLKHSGYPDTPEGRRASMSEMQESDEGKCIMAVFDDWPRRTELWDLFKELDGSRDAYLPRKTGTTGHPKCASIVMVPEPMQTDQSHSIDPRTPDERDMAAIRREEYWKALISTIPAPPYRWALRKAIDRMSGALWRDHAPTPRGRAFVAGLVLLERMHTRG